MTCIACGLESEFRCTIKGLTVCLCSQHVDEKSKYDSIDSERIAERICS